MNQQVFFQILHYLIMQMYMNNPLLSSLIQFQHIHSDALQISEAAATAQPTDKSHQITKSPIALPLAPPLHQAQQQQRRKNQ